MSLMICRGHIRASKGTFQIFLWLTVVWQINILVQFCTLVFISSRIWKGHKRVRRSKNPLRAQSKYGLMGSSAKTGKIFIRGSQEQKRCPKHKSAICNRTPPHLHIKPSLYVCRMVQGSQIIKQNWIILIRSRVIVILLIWVFSALGVGQVGGGCLGWSAIVYMSSGMFRGKESSNRIELSQIVQNLSNFAVLGSLRLWGGDRWVGGSGASGGMGVSPPAHTCMCMHAYAHTHMYTCVTAAGNFTIWPGVLPIIPAESRIPSLHTGSARPYLVDNRILICSGRLGLPHQQGWGSCSGVLSMLFTGATVFATSTKC